MLEESEASVGLKQTRGVSRLGGGGWGSTSICKGCAGMENVFLLDKTSTDDSEEEDGAGWNIVLPLGQFFIMCTEENTTTVLNKAG